MFTGLVDHYGHVLKLEQNPFRMKLWVMSKFATLSLGESISIDGVCLTVTAIASPSFACEVSPETLALTSLDQYEVGQRINLERALTLQDRLGGHFVMGHVDQTLTVSDIQQQDDFWRVSFSGVLPENRPYLIPKGSVAINGVSLTINAVEQDSFSVMLIPHTLQETNLDQLMCEKQVNVEYDHLAKCVAHQLAVYPKEAVS